MKQFIEIKFEKPLFTYGEGFFIYLRDKYLKEAKKTGKVMRIETSEGVGYYTYKEWKDGAKYMEQVFKFKDMPLKLWGNYLIVGNNKEKYDDDYNHEQLLLSSSKAEYDSSRSRLSELWKKALKKD